MINKFRQDILSRKFSALEAAKTHLKRAKVLHQKTNAFTSFCDELALESARAIDTKVQKKQPLGKLAGIPIAIKDLILVKGYPASAASKILEPYIASYDADVVKFLKQEDAIIVGKTNMDEFAMGSSSESSAFGPVKNVIGNNLVSGGSSGGSAVAVAGGAVPVALGSDTGGSVRQPASFTSIVGLKPTYGRVSRSGLIAMSSSFDQIGVFAKSVEDAGIVLDVIAKETPYDSTYARQDFHFSPLSREELLDDLSHITVGLPKEFFGEGLQTEIKNDLLSVMKSLEKQGTRIEWISLPSLSAALACYYIIMPAEASSNLARYDGVRYGGTQNSNVKTQNLLDRYAYIRGRGFGNEVRRRILMGTYVLSAGYIDKYYVRAQKARSKIVQEFTDAFGRVDVIAGPTSPTFPFPMGSKLNDPVSMYLSDIYTVGVNLAGLPAISIPLKGTKLPAGLQLIVSHFEEQRLLNMAQAIELMV